MKTGYLMSERIKDSNKPTQRSTKHNLFSHIPAPIESADGVDNDRDPDWERGAIFEDDLSDRPEESDQCHYTKSLISLITTLLAIAALACFWSTVISGQFKLSANAM